MKRVGTLEPHDRTLHPVAFLYTQSPGEYNCNMEFELEGGSFEAQGNVEVTLPDYMVMLPQAELDEARRAVQRDQMIIAAGRKPDSDEIVVMTATAKLMVLNAGEHGIPTGKVLPIDFGHTVAIEHEGYYEMASDWVIANAAPLDVALLA